MLLLLDMSWLASWCLDKTYRFVITCFWCSPNAPHTFACFLMFRIVTKHLLIYLLHVVDGSSRSTAYYLSEESVGNLTTIFRATKHNDRLIRKNLQCSMCNRKFPSVKPCRVHGQRHIGVLSVYAEGFIPAWILLVSITKNVLPSNPSQQERVRTHLGTCLLMRKIMRSSAALFVSTINTCSWISLDKFLWVWLPRRWCAERSSCGAKHQHHRFKTTCSSSGWLSCRPTYTITPCSTGQEWFL